MQSGGTNVGSNLVDFCVFDGKVVNASVSLPCRCVVMTSVTIADKRDVVVALIVTDGADKQ